MADTFVKIATITVGVGGASTIDFTSIPQTYTDLCIKLSSRDDRTSSAVDGVYINFNGVTTNQSNKELYGTGSGAVQVGSGSRMTMGVTSTNAATANTFGNFDFYIPNYTGNNYKSSSATAVSENFATLAYASMSTNLWQSTASITSISIAPVNGTTFVQYSTATLYGIKNS